MKIQMPQEPDVERLWTIDRNDEGIGEWYHVDDQDENGKWRLVGSVDLRLTFFGMLRRYGAVYTTHPDFAALDKYPAPWTTAASGTVRSANAKVVLDPTLQCPPCLTALIVRAVNELSERMVHDLLSSGEDDKR